MFLIHTSESCTFAPWFFSIYFSDAKKQLNALLFHPKWLDWNLIRHNSQIWTRSPEPLQTMMEKNKIMILCSIYRVMPGLSHPLVPAHESKWSFGRLLLLPVIQKGLFLARKSQVRHANTGPQQGNSIKLFKSLLFLFVKEVTGQRHLKRFETMCPD